MDSLITYQGGYDPTIFVQVPLKYICHMCSNVLRSPVQLTCGHRFCRNCSEEIKLCPVKDCGEAILQAEIVNDHAVRRELMSRTVYCDLRIKGCKVEIQFKDLEAHRQICDYVEIECIHTGCSSRVERGRLAIHLDTECIYRVVQCQYCHQSLTKDVLDLHICPCAPAECPNHCGTKDIIKNTLSDHMSHCPLQVYDCNFRAYGCDYEGNKEQIQNHVTKACQRHVELLLTSHIKLDRKYSELHLHMVENEERMTKLVSQNDKIEERMRKLQSTMTSQNDKIEERMRKLQSTLTSQNVAQKLQSTDCDIAVRESCAELTHALKDLQANDKSICCRIDTIETRLSIPYDGSLVWKMSDYAKWKQAAVNRTTLSLYSPSFYTSKFGYKMRARVYLNGDGLGKNTHLSLFFVIARGEYDSILKWPFQQKVTMCLLDQSTGKCHISDTFRPDPTSSSFKQPEDEMNIASGCPLFAEQCDVESSKYLINDTIILKIRVDTSDL